MPLNRLHKRIGLVLAFLLVVSKFTYANILSEEDWALAPVGSRHPAGAGSLQPPAHSGAWGSGLHVWWVCGCSASSVLEVQAGLERGA